VHLTVRYRQIPPVATVPRHFRAKVCRAEHCHLLNSILFHLGQFGIPQLTQIVELPARGTWRRLRSRERNRLARRSAFRVSESWVLAKVTCCGTALSGESFPHMRDRSLACTCHPKSRRTAWNSDWRRLWICWRPLRTAETSSSIPTTFPCSPKSSIRSRS